MARGKYRRKREMQAAQETQVLGQQEELDPIKGAAQLADLDFAEQAARNAAGQEEKTYGIWGPIWRFTEWYHQKKGVHTFHKRTYLWLMLFLGWMGGHRYYQGRRILGAISTIFFWTGIPLMLCVTDFMEVLPLKADENGRVTL